MSHYLFTMTDAGGTIAPELSVARGLVARGHSVTVLGDRIIADEVAAIGAGFRPWEAAPQRASRRREDDLIRDYELKTPAQQVGLMREILFGWAPGYAADTKRALDEGGYDAVVSCFFLVGAQIAAEARGLPHAVLVPNLWGEPGTGLPPFGAGLQPASGPLGRARDALMTRVATRLWNKALPDLNALRAGHGLPPVAGVFEQFRDAQRLLVLSAEAFDFPAARMPANLRYAGPRFDDPGWVEPWAPPPGDEALVLVAFSTTFQDHERTLQRVVDALGALPVRAVVTTGPAIDPASLRAPARVQVVASAPHSAVLREAAAVVTHAGHGIVMKALAADVPMLCMPMGRDQNDNAARVVAHAAGLRLRPRASSRAIGRAVTRLLGEPAFGESAARLGTEIRATALRDLAVDELEALPRRPESYSPSLRSGVRSSGSSRSISFVKMRSERL
ncbi:MAG TPA: glycosyltransferase [Solirubrobacteraceae bacterium]|jgi:MGT family glycosyltransferase|nr:glycosyltransferase [Solirubrobacteraceae bacterium]